MSIILAFQRRGQEEDEFEVSLGHTEGTYLENK